MIASNHDLHAWLSEIEKIGQLRKVQGIPWDKDMGGLVEMILERNKHAPALLFENIPDARQDTSVLCSQIDGIERLALAMDTDPTLGITEFIQAWRQKIRNFQPVDPYTSKTRRSSRIALKKVSTWKVSRCRAGMSSTAVATSAPTTW
jgi:3-polyprenyl-4-hydroxybenzoate decarboxylase